MSPKRIQRKRSKGWRMPEGGVYVGRPSKWGNPVRVQRADRLQWRHPFYVDDGVGVEFFDDVASARSYAAEVFTSDMRKRRSIWDYPSDMQIIIDLGGLDLACWCPLDLPCHADVLLEIANSDGPTDQRSNQK